MASLHHATVIAVLTFVVLVSGAGIVPGTGATSVGEQAVSIQSDALDAMESVDSYRAVTNMDVSIGANRTFTNVTTLANRSLAATSVYSTDSNDTTHVVDDRAYRNTSDGWEPLPSESADVSDPARAQAALLTAATVTDFQRARTNGRLTYQLELAPRNSTLAGILADQPGNGIERAGPVTVLDRSYEMHVNRTTHRIQRVEMTLKFRHRSETGRATMVTWFTGYNETVPTVPDPASLEN
ncbi:hypothetical protein [Halorientalis regularis]|jgi:hypothetical protein|uniref:Uncharacterized protein n=1 Tax=Halorientalis regularis TaxID=660518 RepID=A0A1G7F9Q1_9EURY|nr:hypothetical protein [Halorientalis regularis]SDE72544.1 hypothetical protein SAMN05216218_10186 [Halorientalis regularis]